MTAPESLEGVATEVQATASPHESLSVPPRLRLASRAGAIVGVGVVVVLLPGLMPNDYVRGLLTLTVIYALYGIGFDVQFGYAGMFNLAQAGFFGVGAYAVTIASTRLDTGNVLVTLPIALGAGVALALVLGTVALIRGGPPITFAMISLGLSQILSLVVLNQDALTSGPAGMVVPQPTLNAGFVSLTFSDLTSLYFLGVLLLALAIFVVERLLRSRLGSSWLCVRENVQLARSQGVRPFRAQMAALMVGASITSVAGGLYAFYVGYLTPDVFALTTLVIAIIVVLVGGSGTTYGAILGALLYVLAPEALSNSANVSLLIFGGLLCVVMIVLPHGLLPMCRRGAHQLWILMRRLA